MPIGSSTRLAKGSRAQKKALTPQLLLAQEEEIQQLITRFAATEPNGVAVQELEGLVRTAIFMGPEDERRRPALEEAAKTLQGIPEESKQLHDWKELNDLVFKARLRPGK